MELNVHERMILIPLLPKEESFAGMGEIYRAKMILQLTEEEAQELLQKDVDPPQLDDVKASAHIKDLPMSEWLTKTIRKILSDKDKAKKLQENELSLFEKFCLDYDQR